MKKKICLCIVLLMFNFFILQNNSIYAHEIFIDSTDISKAIHLKFDGKTASGDVWLKVDYTGLKNSLYKNNISAIYNWNNIVVNSKKNKKIYVTNESVWNANVRYLEDTNVWESLLLTSDTLAITVLYDTNAKQILNYTQALNSTKKVSKAYIYMNSDDSVFRRKIGVKVTNDIINERVKKTITHELGHALCLGHSDLDVYCPISDDVYSVMRQGYPDVVNTGAAVYSHDRSDLINKYK